MSSTITSLTASTSGLAAHLAGVAGILQVDGYCAYKALAEVGLARLAFSMALVRRKFFEIQGATPAPIAAVGLTRVGDLYAIKRDVCDMSAPARRPASQARANPMLDAMKPRPEAKPAAACGKPKIAEAIRDALSRRAGRTRYLDDGRIEIDSNAVEHGMRTVALGRKTPLLDASRTEQDGRLSTRR